MTIAALSPSLSHQPGLHSFSPRSTLPNRLWMIQTGFVRAVTQSGEGVNLALGIWGAGDIVGKEISSVQPFTLECLTRVEAIPTEIDQLPQPTTVVLKHLHQAEELMLIRSYKRTDIMLLKLLSWLATRFGQDAKQGRLIDLRLTHQDLSELLGATRVTVTRALIQLEQQGFIQRLSLQRIVLQQAECWHYEI
jgi:CRP-like cAMP-binding protein